MSPAEVQGGREKFEDNPESLHLCTSGGKVDEMKIRTGIQDTLFSLLLKVLNIVFIQL
ncbi:Uncharacterised protein [Candidatus Venteria ishoeyi]|uniref:Uncharacterized protein n=1 Tax=Candidatus Venteria ishoeyi TaxID=1899563 RepID=A0A1H6FAX4_9GAMM|nr:Uncharacterised protein [Candidatus Venteria ishoeyi]